MKSTTDKEYEKLLGKANQLSLKGLHKDAIKIYFQLANKKNEFAVFANLAATLAKTNDEQAEKYFQKALKISPINFTVRFNYAKYLFEKNNYAKAESYFNQLHIENPFNYDVINNLALAKAKNNKNIDAKNLLTKALAKNNKNPSLYFNLGNLSFRDGQIREALKSYKSVLEIDPSNADALNNIGCCYFELGKYKHAYDSHLKALEKDPLNYDALFNAANVSVTLSDYILAKKYILKALENYPSCKNFKSLLFRLKNLTIEWDGIQDLQNQYAENIGHSTPFHCLSVTDDLKLQKLSAISYQKKFRKSPFPIKKNLAHRKIRVGYISGDYREHPISHLIVEFIENHDRRRFEIHGISFGPNDNSKIYSRIKPAFDYFHDISMDSDADAINKIRNLELDIAIDLAGYTQVSRTNIFSERIAPLQVSYLGYIGTMGAEFIDFLIADEYVVGNDKREYYSEKIVFMPYCYQSCDSKREISSVYESRADVSLPDHGFIFCNFNNAYKIQPETFDCWMNILRQVQDSFLWLLDHGLDINVNLITEAKKRGISPERFIFSQRVPVNEYRERLTFADLMLDTFPYNSGTVANDALWVNLPVLTRSGDSYASRMCGSLLSTLDLTELITTTPESYEAKAIELALHPEKLAAIKKKLQRNRLTSPLFKGKVFARHLESAYIAMHERYHAGLTPDHITIQAIDQADIKTDHVERPPRVMHSEQMQLTQSIALPVQTSPLKPNINPLPTQNPMTTITIDNIEYYLDSLSADAKNQLTSLQFVDQKLAQLQAEIAVFQTARIAYSKALQAALPTAKDKKT